MNLNVSKGLDGVVAAATRLSDVQGDVGVLIYCGYNINELAGKFGSQCVVIGIDVQDGYVYKNTGDAKKMQKTRWKAILWAREVERRGAGEIVLNTMQTDGTRVGYDLKTCSEVAETVRIPVIASGGAGTVEHFEEVFKKTRVSGALAASVFHTNTIKIPSLKKYLQKQGILIRI